MWIKVAFEEPGALVKTLHANLTLDRDQAPKFRAWPPQGNIMRIVAQRVYEVNDMMTCVIRSFKVGSSFPLNLHL